jgi:hypothetical protein
MQTNFNTIYQKVRDWAEDHGVHVLERQLPHGKAGEFNGVSITMNGDYEAEEIVYYLVHALGSIIRWSLSRSDIQAMFDELRAAKKEGVPTRLEQAIEPYRAFEIESSEFAVWLLYDLGYSEIVANYTNFMRADLEALTQFHRTGKAPVWRTFFSQWNEDVAAGRRQVPAFQAKPIPIFVPQKIENQEILQEQG